jgi:hypothetical protein
MTNDWSTELKRKVEQLVDGFVVGGVPPERVFDAVVGEINNLRIAYDRDPDPADDDHVVEEPSNEWPSGEDAENRSSGVR